ncbi:MAG: hypothetical protein RL499_1553 [Actinomycetota bacterium]|jgi:hypothetical protein
MDFVETTVDDGEGTATPGRAAKALVVVASLVALIVIPVVVVVSLYFGVSTSIVFFMSPHTWPVFDVRAASCTTVPGSDRALLEIELMAIDRDSWVSVEPLESESLDVAALATVDGRSSASLTRAERRELQVQLATLDQGVAVPSRPTLLVLELARTAPRDGIWLSEVTLRWSYGELAAVQRVPVNLEWTSEGCSASLVAGGATSAS